MKKKTKEYSAITVLKPFHTELTVIITEDIKSVLKRLDLDEEEFVSAAGLFVSSGSKAIIVLSIEHISIGVITHEAAHCTFYVLNNAGQDPIQGEETFAYMLQHVVEFCIDVCNKHKVKL
jgi:hypothetical protein